MAKRKEQTRGTVKPDQRFTCTNSSCGYVFSKPIKVKNLIEEGAEAYDGCPRCLTALSEGEDFPIIKPQAGPMEDVGSPEEIREEEEPFRDTEPKKPEPVVEAKCSHKFGYLSGRPKTESIPDECVMCENIVKCMLKNMTR